MPEEFDYQALEFYLSEPPKQTGQKKALDLKGCVFGKLTVIELDKVENYRSSWLCQCSCGNKKSIKLGNLRSGRSRSCGCNTRIATSQRKKGFRGTRQYYVWVEMKQRCHNPNNSNYKHYGKRGIKVCDRWINSYQNFLEDMGERPKGLTLERVNNDGNYEPNNCKWATCKEQANNRRNSLKVLTKMEGK